MDYLNPRYGIWYLIILFVLRMLFDIGKSLIKKNQEEQTENTEAIKELTLKIARLSTSFDSIEDRLDQTEELKTKVAKLEERVDGYSLRLEHLES